MASSIPPTPRIGFECEFDGVRLAFKPSDAVKATKEMVIRYNNIFVPKEPGQDMFIHGDVWHGDWGFFVKGDNFGHTSVGIEGNAVEVPTCVLEAATAATPIGQINHWVFVRRCLKLFTDALLTLARSPADRVWPDLSKKWFKLESLMDSYNATVAEEWARLSVGLRPENGRHLEHYQLMFSHEVEELKETWTPYFNVENRPIGDRQEPRIRPCLQVNYSLDVAYIGNANAFDKWINMWKDMWICTPDIFLNGVDRLVPRAELQTYADPESGIMCTGYNWGLVAINTLHVSIWRAAQIAAAGIIERAVARAGRPVDRRDQEKMIGAITTIMAMSSVVPPAGQVMIKNSWSQLCKTSPASLRTLLPEHLLPILRPLGVEVRDRTGSLRDPRHLVKVGSLPSRVMKNDTEIIGKMYFFRNKLITPPATTHKKRKAAEEAWSALPNPPPADLPADDYLDAILESKVIVDHLLTCHPINPDIADAAASDFTLMWKEMTRGTGESSEGGATAPENENRYGYTMKSPFHCFWGSDGALEPNRGEHVDGRPDPVYVVLESRFDWNHLNVGFNPHSNPAIFFKAYKAFLEGIVQDDAVVVNLVNKLKAHGDAVVGTDAHLATLNAGLEAARVARLPTPEELARAEKEQWTDPNEWWCTIL